MSCIAVPPERGMFMRPALIIYVAVVALASLVLLTEAGACRPPWIDIIAPAASSAVSGSCEISVKVMEVGAGTVTAVTFLVDGQSVGVDETADDGGKYAVTWDASAATDGPHVISATATLTDGVVVTESAKVSITVGR
jgi:hypothetical protein